MTTCMGGWCTRREKCALYQADSAEIAERLCQPGKANAFSPIKEVKMKKLSRGLVEKTAAQKQVAAARVDAVLAAIDDTGCTLEQLLTRADASRQTLNGDLTGLVESGRVHRAMVSKKFLGTGVAGSCFVYFANKGPAEELEAKNAAFSEANRRQRDSERHAAKRRAKGVKARKPTQRQVKEAQRIEGIRHQERAHYRAKGDNTPAVPPPGKSIKQLPGYTGRSRYAVDGPVTGPFSSLPPGQYAFEAVSAAARAAA